MPVDKALYLPALYSVATVLLTIEAGSKEAKVQSSCNFLKGCARAHGKEKKWKIFLSVFLPCRRGGCSYGDKVTY